jgi:hypothetical protein
LPHKCYIAFKLAFKRPPHTVPYFSIAFAATHWFFLVLETGNHIYNKKGWKTAALDLVSMTIPAVFVWIAGALPLKMVLPSVNVAGPRDVSLAAVEIGCQLIFASDSIKRVILPGG